MLEHAPVARRVRPRGARRRVHRRGAARHGRLEPRARGVPAVATATSRTGCACTCSTRPHPDAVLARARSRSTSRRRCSSSPRSPAGRSRRCRTSGTSTTLAGPTAALRRGHRPGQPARGDRAASDGFRRMFDEPTRTSAGATRCCRTSGSCRRRWWASTSRRCSHRAQVAEQMLRPATTRASRTPASGSALALGELALAGPRQAHVRRSTRRSRASACGPSSSSPSRPASRARASCRSPTSRSATRPSLRRRPRVRVPAQRRRARRAAGRQASTRSQRPGIRRSRCAAHGAADLGRIFFFAEFATAVAGWVLGINPFDQPNVQEAKDNTKRGARRQAHRPGARGAGDERCASCSAAPARRTTWRSWATCRPRTSSTPRSPSCARAIRAATGGGHHVRLRAALPALDRPAPQGRPADRPLPAARPRRRRRPRRSPAPATRSAR